MQILLYRNVQKDNSFVLIASVTSEEAMYAVLRLFGRATNGDEYVIERHKIFTPVKN